METVDAGEERNDDDDGQVALFLCGEPQSGLECLASGGGGALGPEMALRLGACQLGRLMACRMMPGAARRTIRITVGIR